MEATGQCLFLWHEGALQYREICNSICKNVCYQRRAEESQNKTPTHPNHTHPLPEIRIPDCSLTGRRSGTLEGFPSPPRASPCVVTQIPAVTETLSICRHHLRHFHKPDPEGWVRLPSGPPSPTSPRLLRMRASISTNSARAPAPTDSQALLREGRTREILRIAPFEVYL